LFFLRNQFGEDKRAARVKPVTSAATRRETQKRGENPLNSTPTAADRGPPRPPPARWNKKRSAGARELALHIQRKSLGAIPTAQVPAVDATRIEPAPKELMECFRRRRVQLRNLWVFPVDWMIPPAGAALWTHAGGKISSVGYVQHGSPTAFPARAAAPGKIKRTQDKTHPGRLRRYRLKFPSSIHFEYFDRHELNFIRVYGHNTIVIQSIKSLIYLYIFGYFYKIPIVCIKIQYLCFIGQ
jgi:hypothetical protein